LNSDKLLNNDLVKMTMKEHLNEEGDMHHYLWDILMFQSWYKKWVK